MLNVKMYLLYIFKMVYRLHEAIQIYSKKTLIILYDIEMHIEKSALKSRLKSLLKQTNVLYFT